MNKHEELLKHIRFAINDPGAFVKRELDEHGVPAESLGQWGARAVLAALSGSVGDEKESLYSHLHSWIESEIEGWSIRSDRAARYQPPYHGPTDLANQIVAGVLPMLLRRDRLLVEACAERDVLIGKVRRAGRADLVPPWLLTEEQANSLAEQALTKMEED